MRRSLLRNRLNAIFGVALALAACRQAVPVGTLGKQIGKEFHRPIVVSADRRGHMILIVPPPKVDSTADSTAADTTDPSLFARHVAEFALAHSPSASKVKSVTVLFDANDTDSTATIGKYTWSADDLTRKTRVAAGTPDQKSD
jgi:hypothetical protein